MEASAAVRNAGVTLPPMVSSSTFEHSPEEWRVSEQSVRNSGEVKPACIVVFFLCNSDYLLFFPGKNELTVWLLVRTLLALLCSGLVALVVGYLLVLMRHCIKRQGLFVPLPPFYSIYFTVCMGASSTGVGALKSRSIR